MPVIHSAAMTLDVAADASRVTLTNTATGSCWDLDLDTVLASSHDAPVRFSLAPADADALHVVSFDSRSASVEPLGDDALIITRRGPAGVLSLRFELSFAGLRVTALPDRTTVTACSLPGAFRPRGVTALPVALPKNQGIFHRGTGREFSFNLAREGHGGFTMPFFAAVGEADALLAIIEDEHDAQVWFEKTPDGRIIASAVAQPSLGRLSYPRSVLLRFVPPDVTSICLSYRRYVIDHGSLVTWEEKIAARPNLDKLFGALMCFIGYCQDDRLDYAASLRRLKTLGFDRAFVYPLAFGNMVEGFLMGGRPPIDIRRHLPLLDELGYLSAAWMWTEDVPDNGSDVLLDRSGNAAFSWQIDDMKWFRACPVAQVPLSNRIQDARMAGFTAHHFDVTASRGTAECFHPDHPLDCREDALWRRKVLRTGVNRGLVVSSEGFWGYASPDYDIGSVKIAQAVHADYYTVPMTSLVYHDSLVHDWWEVDNYNNPHHRSQGGRGKRYFPLGGGWARLQAAQDALAGHPPNVMPFGAQYAFVQGDMFAGTQIYRYDLDSPEVVEALRLALPVARLHRRIGKMPLISHETILPDGSLQATVFEDGTRVVANFSDEPRETPDCGPLAPFSWTST